MDPAINADLSHVFALTLSRVFRFQVNKSGSINKLENN